jgi:branched-chain amino acid transport system permease protein
MDSMLYDLCFLCAFLILRDSKRRLGRYSWGWAILTFFVVIYIIRETLRRITYLNLDSPGAFGVLIGTVVGGIVLMGGFIGLYKVFTEKKAKEFKEHLKKQMDMTLFQQHQQQKKIIWLMYLLLIMYPLRFSNVWFQDQYIIHVLFDAGCYVILALGLNIIIGFTGLLNLGYIAFFGIGAYTYAILNTFFHLSFWIAFPIAGLVTALFGLLLGAPSLRVRGDYLAIVTLGFGEIVRIVLNNWESVTNGPRGMDNIAPPAHVPTFQIMYFIFSSEVFFYYMILILIIITIFIIRRLDSSRIGRAWNAIREDEVAAASMGIPILRMKLLAFSLGAFFAGLVGCLFAARQGFVSPESFTFMESVIVVSMVVLGGIGSIPGAILGAVILALLPELLRFPGFESYRMLVFAIAMIFLMLFRPQGLLGSKRRFLELHPVDEKTRLAEDEVLSEIEKK